MKNNRFQRRLILSVIGVLTVVLSTTVVLTLNSSRSLRNVINESVESELISISVAAGELIDVDRFVTYNSIESIEEDYELYMETLEQLSSLQEKVGATYIYAIKIIEGKYYFIFDTDENFYGDVDEVFEEYELSDVHRAAFNGEDTAGIMNVVDEWGSYNTGAIPIRKDGNIIGIISVDKEDDFIRKSGNIASINIIIITATLLLIMGLVIIFVRRYVVAPIRRITDSVANATVSEGVIVGAERDDEFGVLARTIQHMLHDIKARDNLLVAVNRATVCLLAAEVGEFESALRESMGILSRAVDADRMHIWKNSTINGKLYCTQLYEWSEGAGAQHGNEYTVDISYDEHMPGWVDKFLKKQCVNNTVKNMSEKEKAQLIPQGTVSILVVPVYFKEDFWGFVGFDDCTNERIFTESEESILRAGSLLITSAFLRNDMTLELGAALTKAQEASTAKTNFLANMSHEIRTPMNAIIGMTNIGKSTDTLERKDYSLMRIEDASYHLLGVINDILDVSKIESGKFELSNADFDFEKLMKRVVNVISFRVDEKKQQFSIYIDRDIPKNLVGDDQRLAQVITNILGNSVKFTPERGSILIKTYFIKEEDGVCELKISVADTGIGISPEQQKKLFQSFSQAESNMARKFGGTGLGLAISKSIVEMMGGDIWAESELDKGSIFTFTVKLKRGKERSNNSRNIDWKSIRILAVDDDNFVLRDFKGIVSKFGAHCDTAECAIDALKLLEENENYNLFFVDWRMPGMDGLELTVKLKELIESRHKSFVVMLSAAESSTISGKAREAGVDKLMMKPLFPSTIEEIVAEYFGEEAAKQDGNEGDVIEEIFKGYRVLLAEDVEINREIVLALLEPTGLMLDCAENGREAVNLFAKSPEKYDMIFMDLQMPEMDGYTATQEIRALSIPKAREIPIVAMTANVFKEDVDKCLASGMNDHVGKPIDLNVVLDTLRKYLL